MPDSTSGGSGSPAGAEGEPTPHANSLMGSALGPVLLEILPQLTDLHWFRTDWQRGGALTGYAQYQTSDGPTPVVVKLPVRPRERRWLERLQPDQHDQGDVAPKLYAAGDTLHQYDMVWLVMERLPHGPLDSSWEGEQWEHFADTLGRFYAVAAAHPVDQPPRDEDWVAIFRKARKHIHERGIAEEQRWNTALKDLQKKMKKVAKTWDARDTQQWCHGDAHLRNCMTREPAPQGPALLFDYAEVRAGHWVEDAVYLEHLYWGHESYLGGHDIVKLISQKRKAHGIKLESNWPMLANIRRALLAGSAPAYLHNEGNPAHLHGALLMLEKMLPVIH